MSTQKTAWLIVACCLLLFTSEGLSQEELPDPPRWHVNRETDPITDDKRVFAQLRGKIVGTSLTLDGTPSIIIVCNTIGTYVVSSPQGDLDKDFSLNVSINSPVLRPEFDPANPNRPPLLFDPLSVTRDVDRDVIVRFDSEEPEVERWGATDFPGWRDVVSLYDYQERYQPYAFLERLATGAHRRLAVRTRDHDIVWTAIFDISKAAPVAQEVLETCPESDSKSVP